MIKLQPSAIVCAASVPANKSQKSWLFSKNTPSLVLLLLLLVSLSNGSGAFIENVPDNDEVCRYLDSEKCKEIEDSFVRMRSKTRSRITASRRPRLVTFNSETKGQEPFELKTLVVLVAWKGYENRLDWITREEIDRLWNGLGTDNDIIPTGSIKTYTERQAYGSIRFVADVIDWQVTDNTEAYYADKRSGLPKNGDREPHLRTAFHYIMNQMDEEGFPWEDYDSDGDGMIDHVQFLHNGYGAESGSGDCYSGAREEDRIWSHALPEGQAQWTSSRTGIELGGYSTSSVFRGTCGQSIARLGIMMHEFYHTLGLPDLYDRDLPYAGSRFGLGGIGIFDMMAAPFGANGNQKYPGSLSPWSKLEMGFLEEPIEITKSGIYTARPSSDFPDIYSIKRGYPEGETLLLENRQNTGFDATLPTGGMLIFKIDETIDHNGNRKHGYPGQLNAPDDGESWPSNGLHYPIALLQADGNYDLEQARNNGDAGDFYNSPSQVLGPGNGESVASSDGTYPNTDSYVDGEIKITGTTIDNFRETPEGSGIFTFRVTFEGDEPVDDSPTQKPTTPPTKAPIPTSAPTKNPTIHPFEAPSFVPTSSPAPTASSAPSMESTLAPIDASDCGHILQVNITTDSQPNQTTWEVTSVTTGKFLTGFRSSDDLRPKRALEEYTEYGWKICVQGTETAFVFSIFDTGGDGLQHPGSYSVSLDGNIISTGGTFVNETSIEFHTTRAEERANNIFHEKN